MNASQYGPFVVPGFDPKEVRLEPLHGLANKFTLFLPVLRDGYVVFSETDEQYLHALFMDFFGGYTATANVTHPLRKGGYVSASGLEVLDHHTVYEVYARQSPRAKLFFEKLTACLTGYTRDQLKTQIPNYSGEEQILVELSTVSLL